MTRQSRSHLFLWMTNKRHVLAVRRSRRRRRSQRRLIVQLDGRTVPASAQTAATVHHHHAAAAQPASLRLEPVQRRSERVQQRLERVSTGGQRVAEFRGPVTAATGALSAVRRRRTGHRRCRSVLVQETDAARRHVAIVAEIQTQVSAAVDVAAQAHRVLLTATQQAISTGF